MTSNDSQNKGLTLGILSALGAYCIWGMIALYWKLLTEADDVEILAHRIVWSLVFVIGLLIVKHQLGSTLRLLKNLFTAPKENHTLLLVFVTNSSLGSTCVGCSLPTSEKRMKREEVLRGAAFGSRLRRCFFFFLHFIVIVVHIASLRYFDSLNVR